MRQVIMDLLGRQAIGRYAARVSADRWWVSGSCRHCWQRFKSRNYEIEEAGESAMKIRLVHKCSADELAKPGEAVLVSSPLYHAAHE